MRLLVVEDEPALASAIADALLSAGHAVDLAPDGIEATDLMVGVPYDLVVLDLGLPGRSGLDVCSRARQAGFDAPILMLTARDALADKVEGLDRGADDYLVKPVELEELLARVRALLRRRAPVRGPLLRAGDLELDPATRVVTRAGRRVSLARKELALLEYFLRNPGRLLTRTQILDHVWDADAEHDSDVVRAHVKGLRKAIGDVGSPRLIQTVHGLGFRLVVPGEAPDAAFAP